MALLRTLAAAALLALPALAHAAGEEIIVPIGIVGIVFGSTALVVAIVAYAAHRNRQLRHETIRLALEKGQPLPPGLLDPPEERGGLRDLRRGLVLIALGAGIALALAFSESHGGSQGWGIGFIPAFLGLAYVTSFFLSRRLAPPAERR